MSSAQGNSPNNLSLSDAPDRNNVLMLEGQQTPVSLEQHEQVDPDSESFQERLLDQQQPSPASSDSEASSLIKLDNGDVLYMREVNR